MADRSVVTEPRQDQPAALPRTAYTVTEVAQSLGISAQSVHRYVANGHIKAVKLGGRVLIPADVFHNLLTEAPSAAE